ncbi:MAG: hypothetical protein U1F65_05760 [Verrucomicrobiota bacterium]
MAYSNASLKTKSQRPIVSNHDLAANQMTLGHLAAPDQHAASKRLFAGLSRASAGNPALSLGIIATFKNQTREAKINRVKSQIGADQWSKLSPSEKAHYISIA